MSVIFSELLDDYFLSNIKNDLFEDEEGSEEHESVDPSKYYKSRLAQLLQGDDTFEGPVTEFRITSGNSQVESLVIGEIYCKSPDTYF